MFGLDAGMTTLLLLCLLAAVAFEFINGFHDTANAVATVIYTRSLKPRTAVIWSGIWNFIGVYFGGIAVAIGIINLLPLEMLVDQNIYHSMSMVASLIFTAILWNLGTWYFGIPCSSSHTLIGSIFGVGLAHMFIADSGSAALNWNKVGDAGLALLISPVFGFVFTLLLVILFGRVIRKKKFFAAANPSKKPPFWIRSLLVASSTAVSFSHGSNDGQKGVGLIMIILMGIVPAKFALDSSKSLSGIIGNVNHVEWYVSKIDSTKLNSADAADLSVLRKEVQSLKSEIAPLATPEGKLSVDNFHIRKEILTISKLSGSLSKCLSCEDCSCYGISEDDIKLWMQNVSEIRTYTEYAPWWVILLVSISLGLGTMIGWKRVAVTVGEKIGKTQLSYAQGASAGIVAASTIAASSGLGLPVSTTHVLSSGIAGSMVTRGGFKNLQTKTITSILIAWLVTIPVTVAVSAGLFLLLRYLFV